MMTSQDLQNMRFCLLAFHKKTGFEYRVRLFPNSEILFDSNEGSSRVFKDHLISYLDRGGLPWGAAELPSPCKIQYLVNMTFKTPRKMNI